MKTSEDDLIRTPPLEVLLDDIKIVNTHVEAITGTIQDAGSFPAASTLFFRLNGIEHEITPS